MFVCWRMYSTTAERKKEEKGKNGDSFPKWLSYCQSREKLTSFCFFRKKGNELCEFYKLQYSSLFQISTIMKILYYASLDEILKWSHYQLNLFTFKFYSVEITLLMFSRKMTIFTNCCSHESILECQTEYLCLLKCVYRIVISVLCLYSEHT